MSNSDLIHQYDFAPVSKAVVLPNGYLHFVAPFFRVTDSAKEKGIRYFDRAGKPYYQRVSKELLKKTAATFRGLTITDAHPPQFLDSKNTRNYSRGLTGTSNTSTYVTDRFSWITGIVSDEELIEGIKEKKKREISPGYLAALKDTDQDDIKDRIDMIGNHLAFVTRGRNGSLIGLNLDSDDQVWEFCEDVEQFDSDYIQQVKREIDYLPREFLDFSYLQQSTVNLDLFPVKTEEKSPMKTANLVLNSQVFTIQSDRADEVANLFDQLKGQVATLEKEKSELTAQKDQAEKETQTEKGKAEALKSELETANKKAQTDSAANTKKQAVEMAVSMFKVLPKLLAVNPKYELSEDSLSEVNLMRDFLVAVLPERKDQLTAMNLDSDSIEGAKNIGMIEALFEIKSGELDKKQQDSQQQKPYSSLEELKLLLTNSTSKQQDSHQPKADQNQATKDYVTDVDSRF